MCNAVIFTTVGLCSLLYTPVRVCPFVCLVTQIIPIHPHTVHSICHSSGTARALQQLPHQVGDVQTGMSANLFDGRGQLKCDGTRAETRFRLSAKRTSPFKSAGASVQSTTGSRGVRISGSNAGYTMFRGSVKGTGYLLHLPISPSLPLPCVTVCHHISTGVYY